MTKQEIMDLLEKAGVSFNKKASKAELEDTLQQAIAPVEVTAGKLNIRATPSTEAEVLWIAKQGEILKAYPEVDGWRALVEGGYVMAKHVA